MSMVEMLPRKAVSRDQESEPPLLPLEDSHSDVRHESILYTRAISSSSDGTARRLTIVLLRAHNRACHSQGNYHSCDN